MSGRLLEDTAILRRTPAGGEARGRVLVERSLALVSAGVKTPRLKWDETRGELTAPLVAGEDGRDWMKASTDRFGAGRTGSRLARGATEAIRSLHQVALADTAIESLDVATFDPWLRIRPRLESFDSPLSDRFRGHAGELEAAQPATGAPVLVHGDFHPGQLLVTDRDPWWLVDLDDLALGDLESDLGNFTAYLASADASPRAAFRWDFDAFADSIMQAYVVGGGEAPAPRLVIYYGSLAMLRRSLKARENGVPTDLVLEILSRSERLLDRYWRGQS